MSNDLKKNRYKKIAHATFLLTSQTSEILI